MEFKKLELEQEGSWIKRTLSNPHTKKTLIAILIGAVASFAFFYFSEGIKMDKMPVNEILKSMGAGAFLGFFITNSPCSRGRC